MRTRKEILRGQIRWLWYSTPGKRRPALVLGRDEALPYAASWQHSSAGGLPDEAPGGSIQAALSVPTAPCCWSYAAAWRHSYQEAAQERPAKSTHFRGLDGNRGKNSPEIRRKGDIIQCSAAQGSSKQEDRKATKEHQNPKGVS